MSSVDDAKRALADAILAARQTGEPMLTLGTVVTDNGDGSVMYHPDGAPEDTVVGPVWMLGG